MFNGLLLMKGLDRSVKMYPTLSPWGCLHAFLALGRDSADKLKHTELPAHRAGNTLLGCLWRETEPPGQVVALLKLHGRELGDKGVWKASPCHSSRDKNSEPAGTRAMQCRLQLSGISRYEQLEK